MEKDVQQLENHGNFHALLKFRVDSWDTILGQHLVVGAQNATYTSSVIQNQIIEVLGDQVCQKRSLTR